VRRYPPHLPTAGQQGGSEEGFSVRRPFNGLVTELNEGRPITRGLRVVYATMLGPQMWLLSHRSDCRIWMGKTSVGICETLFFGSAPYSEIGSLLDREKHFSGGTVWRGDIVSAAGAELFRFDGHLAKPCSLTVRFSLGLQSIQPSAIFARDEKLYVFDYGLRYFMFNATEWRERDIPEDLSERPFKVGVNKRWAERQL
jgi:hypothetical protein